MYIRLLSYYDDIAFGRGSILLDQALPLEVVQRLL